MTSTIKATNAKRTGGDAKGRGRGSYASKACNMCRRKKVRCDESKPVCGACVASGRETECQYTGETARQPRTQAHFSAIKNYANALKQYANILESMVEKCHREHGFGSLEGTTYLQLRPKDPFDGNDTQDNTRESDGSDSDEGSDISELCFSSQNLKLEDRHLTYYGSAAPFRYASEHPDTPDETPRTSRFSEINANPRERYVLMVDGVDPSHCNPYFDWSRHLPSQVPLDRKEHDRIIDLLFNFFSCWGMRVVPTLFLRDMYRYLSVPRHETPIKRSHYSPMLHNALLSVAAGFSDDPRVRDYKSRKCFADEAKRFIDEECAEPNVSVIHALSILSCFHSSAGEHALGYVYFGMSARISQALGLTVDCSDWVKSGKIALPDMYDRNWAYWTTFSEDVCWSLYVGRDFCVPEPSDRHKIPFPFIDTDYDQIPWEYPPSKVPPQPNNLSRTFAASCELLTIARRVMDIVNALHSVNRRQVGDEMISSIDLKLHEWKSKLPPEVDITLANKNTCTPHRLMTHLTFHWIFILLHRPFFLRKKRSNSDRVIDHVKLCRTAAENVMDLMKTWRTLYTLRYIPATCIVQIVFAAGTIYVVLAIQATSGLRVAKESLRNFLSQAELCVQYLNEMGQSWKCASDIAYILKKLLQQQLKPILEKRMVAIKKGDPTTPPPAQPLESPSLPSAPSRLSTSIPHTGYSSSSNAYTGPPQTPVNGSWLAPYNNGITTESNALYPSSSTAPAYNPPPTVTPATNSGSHGGHDFSVMETAGFLAMADREVFATAPFIAPFHNEGFSMEDMEYLQQADDSPAMSWIQDDNMMTDWQDLDFASFHPAL